jgi:L-ascorbate metabolism protein UlaG (beta-lactamase superfamily)
MLPTGTPIIAPAGSGGWLHARGFGDVHELRPHESLDVGAVRVVATPAVHEGRRAPFGPRSESIGFTVAGSHAVYFAGDTDLFPEMANLAPSIDVALLPVWGWGPSVGPGHLDPERAAAAAALIAPGLAVPIHWGSFALPRAFRRRADPAWPAREFAALAARQAPPVEARVLVPGEQLELHR